MYYSHIAERRIPWVYGLRFDPITCSIIIDLHKKAFAKANDYFIGIEEGCNLFSKEYGYKDYLFIFNNYPKNIGYDLVGHISLVDEVASIRFQLHAGETPEDLERHRMAVCDSITIILSALNCHVTEIKDDTIAKDGEPIQLCEIETCTMRSTHGYGLVGYINSDIRKLCQKKAGLAYGQMKPLRNVFHREIKKLFGAKGDRSFGFHEEGGFFIQVPGNSCDIGIYGEEREQHIDLGAEIGSHNVDSPTQQLGLLIGLSMVLDLYYKEHPPTPTTM